MTVIIGLKHSDGTVHMGADDMITSDVCHHNGNKIVVYPSGIIVVFAGSLATQTTMMSATSPFAKLQSLGDDEVREAFNSFQSITNFQAKGASDGSFWCEVLMAHSSSLFYMGGPVGGVYRVTEEFRCIGSGGLIATGAMDALRALEPHDRIQQSIAVTSRWIKTVGVMNRYEHT